MQVDDEASAVIIEPAHLWKTTTTLSPPACRLREGIRTLTWFDTSPNADLFTPATLAPA